MAISAAMRSASGNRTHRSASAAAASGSSSTRSPDEGTEQGRGLRAGQHVEVDPGGAVAGDEAGQIVAAGDDDGAGGRARQQRPHLVRRAGVVEDDEHAPVGQQRPVMRRPLGDVQRDFGRAHPQAAQEGAQGEVRRHRRLRPVAPQVDVELPVREALGHPVGAAHGERGLPDARCAGDGGDDDRGSAGPQAGVQFGDLVGAADEGRHIGRQLPGHRDRRWTLVGPARRRPATREGPAAFLDPVPGRGQRALLARRGAEEPDERVETIRRRQHVAGQVLADDAVRPTGRRRQFAIGQLGAAAAAGLSAPQLAEHPREVGQRGRVDVEPPRGLAGTWISFNVRSVLAEPAR